MKKASWLVVLLLAGAACGKPETAEPQSSPAPVSLGSDLSALDVCKLVPVAEIESVLGRKLVAPPQRFEYYEAHGTSGCSYDAGKNARSDAFFGYVALTPAQVYDEQPRHLEARVDGIGRSAYFNNGPDARQLWVKINDKAALVVAFGDEPREEGARKIAELVLGLVR